MTFKEKSFFYCWEHRLSQSQFDDLLSALLNDEMSTVVDSEKDRLINYY